MNIEDYMKVDEAIDKAEESDTPFVVVANNEVNVVGDANKTEINKHDYVINFRIFKNGKYEWVKQEFKDVYITPRNDLKVSRMLTQLLPYFRKDEDGEIVKHDKDEVLSILEQDTLLDSLYDTVAAVLNIPANLKPFMATDSVIAAATQIIRDFPETVNEADTFFG